MSSMSHFTFDLILRFTLLHLDTVAPPAQLLVLMIHHLGLLPMLLALRAVVSVMVP
jgi:hypothetical protein